MSLAWMKDLAATPGSSEAEPSENAVERLNRAYVPPIRLGLTVHAGEDFEDPLTGLRHIHESVCALELRPGDRVGHAIAAALNTKLLEEMLSRRAAARGTEVECLKAAVTEGTLGDYRIRKPRGTHLLDLAWAFDQLAFGKAEDELRARTAALLAEAAVTSFGHPADPLRLAAALRGPGTLSRPVLPGVRFEDPSHLHPEDWTWVRVDVAWHRLFEQLRCRVLTLLVQKGIVVESCPTSNVVVANLTQPPLDVFADVPGLRCVLATDDPGLLGAFPAAEMRRWVTDDRRKEAILAESARASFVRACP